jgi:hypothetical protein
MVAALALPHKSRRASRVSVVFIGCWVGVGESLRVLSDVGA